MQARLGTGFTARAHARHGAAFASQTIGPVNYPFTIPFQVELAFTARAHARHGAAFASQAIGPVNYPFTIPFQLEVELA